MSCRGPGRPAGRLGALPVAGPALYRTLQGFLVNTRGEHVDQLGRLARARGAPGLNRNSCRGNKGKGGKGDGKGNGKGVGKGRAMGRVMDGGEAPGQPQAAVGQPQAETGRGLVIVVSGLQLARVCF